MKVLYKNKLIDGNIIIKNDLIEKVVIDSSRGNNEEGYILPGLIDLHTHGAMGFDFNTVNSLEGIKTITDFYVRHGVTSVFATVMTDDYSHLKKQLSLVGEAMKNNKMWYTLKFNGELEKLCNAEIYESIGRFLQYLSAILNLKPEVAHAINGYEFLELLKSVSNLVNGKLIKNKYDFENIIKKLEEAQAQQTEIQNLIAQSQMAKNMASAGKDGALENGTA